MSEPVSVRSTHRISRHIPLLLAGAALALTAAKAKQCVPTPQELICEADSECGGPPPTGAICDGAWACVDAGCEWVCNGGGETSCYSSSECGAGQHCSVDDGVCGSPGDCGPGMGCIALCTGTCVDDQATLCNGDYDCPTGMVCDWSGAGGGSAEAAIWCPPCNDPALPCDCGAPPPPEGVCVKATETCDGMDNDGDGLVDEGGVCGAGDCYADSDCPVGYLCSGASDGCGANPGVPNGPAMPCFVAPGTCTPLPTDCSGDWDCPGGSFCAIDPGYYCPPCVSGVPCAPCMAPYGTCQAYTEEICDDMDNDGDGLIDEGDVCGTTMCWGDMDCPAGSMCEFGACPPCVPGQVCPTCVMAQFGYCSAPQPEPCDGIDNDGDGLVDEDGCPGPDQCYADSDCAAGELCVATQGCWDYCDPAPGGGCGGGCGTQYVCVSAAP